MELSVSRTGLSRVVRVAGVLNRDSGPDVEAFLLHLFRCGDDDLVVDCTDVESADIDGVGCLLTVGARIRRLGGTVRVSTEGQGPVPLSPGVALALLRPGDPVAASPA